MKRILVGLLCIGSASAFAQNGFYLQPEAGVGNRKLLRQVGYAQGFGTDLRKTEIPIVLSTSCPFDMSSAVHLRSASLHLPDYFTTAFCLNVQHHAF